MIFPLLNISVAVWKPNEYWDYVIFDEYIYTDKESIFKELYQDKKFIDATGKIYRGVSKAELTEKWRNWLRFIPNVWKKEVVFRSTGEQWTTEELRTFAMNKLSTFPKDESTRHWMQHVRKASNHAQIIFPDF